ncbi:MAG: ATP-binding cassette domain-containing protein [Candidatus Tectomicrobia bacterium]|uniref:ATP-binding cassette domain-containing protein n=1 Tax=Tectimicrobiota bacterium TaxID=2528274 RepID=A0A932GM97_UNCTE|nr:ATP-binding cassette domain-containing protein [Candidatus Tectomicrobia bacterium]
MDGSQVRVEVLESVSLSFEQGSFTSIVGPSGCGKSTFLQMVAGLLRPSQGEVRFRGRPVSSPHPAMIYLFQQYNRSLFAWKTVSQNIAFGLKNRPHDRRTLAQEVARAIQAVGLQGFENHYPTVLFITHDIDEAIYLAQRVVVMSRAPARVVAEFEVPMSYPRHQIASRENPIYLDLRRRVFGSIGSVFENSGS